jgi:hypothetical protein
MIDQLHRFPSIGWDFDGTLIDHPKSPLMHEFILSNPDKRHLILTFRTHGMQTTMFREMQQKYPDAPGPDCFAAIHNIPDSAWERFFQTAQRRRLHLIDGPLTPWEEYYVEWKGMTCQREHLPIMIDDKAEHVLPGCEKYGILYLHPDEL